MNTLKIVVLSASFIASTAGTYFISKKIHRKAGKLEILEDLRTEQIKQASEDAQSKFNKRRESGSDALEIQNWLEKETAAINEMYDGIVNKVQ